MPRAFRIGKRLVAWFLALYIVVGLSYLHDMAPAPERFSEASSAFLYSSFVGSKGAILFAILGLCLGMPLRALLRWRKRRDAEAKEGDSGPVMGTRRFEGTVYFFLAMGWLGALAAVPLIPLETRSYRALTDAGVVSRDYWGAIESHQWSSFQRVELRCSTPRRKRRHSSPSLRLRFEEGEPILILGMTPYRMTEREALGHFEDLRLRERVPLIWSTTYQREGFQSRDERMVECIDGLLKLFPPEKHDRMLAELTSNPARVAGSP
jgi:hypothetical protein